MKMAPRCLPCNSVIISITQHELQIEAQNFLLYIASLTITRKIKIYTIIFNIIFSITYSYSKSKTNNIICCNAVSNNNTYSFQLRIGLGSENFHDTDS